MRTYAITIGTLNISVRSDRAHAEGQEEIITQINWRTLCQFGQTVKANTLAGLRNLLTKYEAYQAERHKEYIAQWPPHSIMCEKRCCNRAISSFWRYMKKELQWGKDGHLI